MLRKVGYAAILVGFGAALGAAGSWTLRDDVERFVARARDKAARTMDQWQEAAPPPEVSWQLAAGLRLETHAEGLDYPARIAFAPRAAHDSGNPSGVGDPPEGDRVLYYVAEVPGRIRAVTPDGRVSTVASDLLDFEWSEIDELGLMGLAVDPDGTRLYAALTYWDEAAGVYRNRLDVLALGADGRSVTSRTPLLDMQSEPTVASYCIQFVEVGPDGRIYLGVGKGGNAMDAQDLDRFAGKVLRMSRNGEAVPENPYYDAAAPDAPRSYVYAYGFRNPFDIAFDPSDPRIAVVSDVGPGVDRIVRLERGGGYCFGPDPGDEAMRCNALFTWGPTGAGHAPTGVAITDGPPFAPDAKRSLFVGMFGAVHMPGPNTGKQIQRFAFDPSGALESGPQPVARYQGLYYSSVTDVVVRDGAIYFADIFGDGELPHRDSGRVYRIRADTAATAVEPRREEPALSVRERGAELFQQRGCFACHARDASEGDREGPVLGSDLATRLRARLDDEAYTAELDALAARPGAYFVARRALYAELRELSGAARTRRWFEARIRDPRFDDPKSKMPAFPELTDAEIEALATFLLGER